jgi:integrase
MGVRLRYGKWYIRFEFKGHKIEMDAGTSLKSEAQRISLAIQAALKSGSYCNLDPPSREVAIRLFKSRGWHIPESLRIEPVGGAIFAGEVEEELTLKQAANLCYSDAESRLKGPLYRERLRQCFAHLLVKLGPDTPVKHIKVAHIKKYVMERQQEGAAPATIDREKAALSKIYRILMENDKVDRNPVKLVRPCDNGMGRRHVYISHADFDKIVGFLPQWCRPIAIIAYYTGMRQGEVRNFTRSQIDMNRRVIRLTPEDTKEKGWKTVPIHWDLMPWLRQVLRSASSEQVVGLETVFLLNGRPINRRYIPRAWDAAVEKAELPGLHFHDLRHTWKTNARRSGIDEEVRMKIMGHATRQGSTHEGYGVVNDAELLKAIDRLTFDHGETDVWVAQKNRTPRGGSQGALEKAGANPVLKS